MKLVSISCLSCSEKENRMNERKKVAFRFVAFSTNIFPVQVCFMRHPVSRRWLARLLQVELFANGRCQKLLMCCEIYRKMRVSLVVATIRR